MKPPSQWAVKRAAAVLPECDDEGIVRPCPACAEERALWAVAIDAASADTRASILDYLRRQLARPGLGSNPVGPLFTLGYRHAVEGVIAAIEHEADLQPAAEPAHVRTFTDRSKT